MFPQLLGSPTGSPWPSPGLCPCLCLQTASRACLTPLNAPAHLRAHMCVYNASAHSQVGGMTNEKIVRPIQRQVGITWGVRGTTKRNPWHCGHGHPCCTVSSDRGPLVGPISDYCFLTPPYTSPHTSGNARCFIQPWDTGCSCFLGRLGCDSSGWH